jgi:hypothetical protein
MAAAATQKLMTLSALLQEEVALHEALKGELDHEAKQDGALDGPAVLRTQQRKLQTVRRIQDLEAKRIALIKDLARDWQEPPEELTLRRIIPRAPQAIGAELQGSYTGLLAAVHEIRDLARITGANAQARLKAVDATLAIVHDAVKVHPTYSEAGRLQNKPVTFKYTSA